MEERRQIGHSPLHIIVSAEETQQNQGRMLWLDIKILWFKLANLDKGKKVIDHGEVTFEGPSVPVIARFLAGALQDLLDRSYIGSVRSGGSDVVVARSSTGGAVINNGSQSVEVAGKDINELIDQLGYIVAMSNVSAPF